MQLSRLPDGSVRIESKPVWLTLGVSVNLNGVIIPGPGEYDVAGIQCQRHIVGAATSTLIRLEDLVISFVEGFDAGIAKSEGMSATHILVVSTDTGVTLEQLRSLIKELDPGYLVLTGNAHAELESGLGLTPATGTSLKVSLTSLPAEGCQLATLE